MRREWRWRYLRSANDHRCAWTLCCALSATAPALGTGIALAFMAQYPARAQSLQRADMVERMGMRTAVEQSLTRSYFERFQGDRQRYCWGSQKAYSGPSTYLKRSSASGRSVKPRPGLSGACTVPSGRMSNGSLNSSHIMGM